MVARGRLVKTLIDDNFLFTSIFSLCLFWTRLGMTFVVVFFASFVSRQSSTRNCPTLLALQPFSALGV